MEAQAKGEADDIPKEGGFQQLGGNYIMWWGKP